MSSSSFKNSVARHNYEIIDTIEARYCFNWYRNKIYKKSVKLV